MAKDQQAHDVNKKDSQQSLLGNHQLRQQISTAAPGSSTTTSALSAGYQDSEEAFPFRVYDLLEDAERLGFGHIVSWVHGSNSFFVHDRERFTNGIMPKYFAQSKYKSFQRQLNFYQFERERRGANKGAYSHKYFVRGNRKLCHLITRAPAWAEGGTGSRSRTSSTPPLPIGSTTKTTQAASMKNAPTTTSVATMARAIADNDTHHHHIHDPSSDMFLGFKAQSAPNLMGLDGAAGSRRSSTATATSVFSVGGTVSSRDDVTADASLGLPMFNDDISTARMGLHSKHQLLTTSTTTKDGGGDQASLDPSGDTEVQRLKSPPWRDEQGFLVHDQWVQQHGAHLSQYASALVASVDPRNTLSSALAAKGVSDDVEGGEEGGSANSSPPNSIEREIISTFKKDEDENQEEQ